MAVTMTEDVGTTLQKGLSEWWSEETEYVFQRIERWAAFARGYNRLRSQRLSRGRLTMHEEQESRWSISANKLIIDDSSWSPRFHTLKRSRRKSRPEETKINCCGTFNYQSNSNLDSTCLETYRYDHSIYFKTIGDIRNSKRNSNNKVEEQDRVSISSEELVEWDLGSVSDYLANLEEENNSDNMKNSFDSLDGSEQNNDRICSSAWPIVDLSKLDINLTDTHDATSCAQDNENNLTILHEVEESNNNYLENKGSREDTKNTIQITCDMKETNNKEGQKQQEGIKRYLSFRRTRRLSRTVKQPPVMGENNVIWPGVLLNYTKNIDPATSPHHHYSTQK